MRRRNFESSQSTSSTEGFLSIAGIPLQVGSTWKQLDCNSMTQTRRKTQRRCRKRPRRSLRSSAVKVTTAMAAIALAVLVSPSCLLYFSTASPVNNSSTNSSSTNNNNNNNATMKSNFTNTTILEQPQQQSKGMPKTNEPQIATNAIDSSAERNPKLITKEKAPPLLQKKPPGPTLDDRDIRLEVELQQHAHILEEQHKGKELALNQEQHQQHQEYMAWCQKVLGIQTSLEVHTFYYYDYMTALMTHPKNSAEDDDDDDDFEVEDKDSADPHKVEREEWHDPPMIPVRGLRATRTIAEGETVISIPFQALLTVSTTIDQDPVLSSIMGPKARKRYGWTLEQDESSSIDDESVDFFELPLLAMALLHHRRLGTSSPLFPYINMLQNTPIDSMPYLWSKQQRRELRNRPSSKITQGVEIVARSIRQEMKEMYHTVVDTLVANHPDLFGKDVGSKGIQYDVSEERDWAFSFEKFQWAFAMVNSRHWLLPIVDLETKPPSERKAPSPTAERKLHQQASQPQGSVDGVPPAEMPTDAWLEQAAEDNDDDNASNNYNPPQQERKAQQQQQKTSPTSQHSFLAPMADMLNFGPPCTRGRYNQETHTFDIIASCNFTTGQEVTFWYSDECEEIIIGNYGFTHPMVPKCPTAEEYRQMRDVWRARATSLQEELEDAYEDMDVIDMELQHVQQVVAGCDCPDRDPAMTAHWVQQRRRQQQQKQQKAEPEDPGDGFHANYLRNPQENNKPRQIRGGPMSSGSREESAGGKRSSARSTKVSGNSRNKRQSPRGISSDDEVEQHGVRRMWTGRSAL